MTEIHIRQLPDAYSLDELLRLCASFGEVVSYRALPSHAAVRVEYDDAEDAAAAAANMNGMAFANRHLRVHVVTS